MASGRLAAAKGAIPSWQYLDARVANHSQSKDLVHLSCSRSWPYDKFSKQLKPYLLCVHILNGNLVS